MICFYMINNDLTISNICMSISNFADPCSEVNCGKHASCRIEGTEAFCVCDEGWTYNPKKISAGCLGNFFTLSFKYQPLVL